MCFACVRVLLFYFHTEVSARVSEPPACDKGKTCSTVRFPVKHEATSIYRNQYHIFVYVCMRFRIHVENMRMRGLRDGLGKKGKHNNYNDNYNAKESKQTLHSG
jgi:hypothetical protein